MKSGSERWLIGALTGAVTCLVLAAGCGEEDGPGGSGEDVGDVSSADLATDGDGGASDTGSGDVGSGDAGSSDAEDAGATDTASGCADFAGYYTTAGSCTGGVLELPETICVFLSECEVTAYTEVIGTVFEGSVSGPAASFSTTSAPIQSCDATLEDGDVVASCEIPAAGAECTGTLAEVPSDLVLCCDLVGQNCPDGQRCQPLSLGGGLTSACIEVTGEVGLGESCERDETREGFYDDCQAGLYCTSFGTPAGQRTCRAHCTDSRECGAGEACHIGSGTPAAGRCLPLCSPFAEADAEGACPTGTACRNFAALGGGPGSSMTMCLGAAETTFGEGEACTGADSCDDGLWCHASVCRQPCDPENPCDDGQTCMPYAGRFNVVPGFPAGLGVCQ
jgi:hypothetical protein